MKTISFEIPDDLAYILEKAIANHAEANEHRRGCKLPNINETLLGGVKTFCNLWY